MLSWPPTPTAKDATFSTKPAEVYRTSPESPRTESPVPVVVIVSPAAPPATKSRFPVAMIVSSPPIEGSR
ncbi:MAG: hypothetical protein ACK528_01135, partial [Alphaproteobacteria bacterium]